MISGVKNPLTNLPTDPIAIKTYGMYVEDSYPIDEKKESLTFQAKTLGGLTVQSVTRSTAELNAAIEL